MAISHDPPDLRSIVRDVVPMRQADGKIDIPPYFTHIKFDIGLSNDAPNSQYWLSHEDDLIVFGFEPNPESQDRIRRGTGRIPGRKSVPLETRFIGETFFLLPCALGSSAGTMAKLFVTSNDPGCSSLYVPRDFDVKRVVDVPIFPLSAFIELLPFDTHPVIDHIKIDAQGSDLDIVKSAGQLLQERVAYVTLEAEDSQYLGTTNSRDEIEEYMRGIGFIPYTSEDTHDPTYFNPRYSDYVGAHDVRIYQD